MKNKEEMANVSWARRELKKRFGDNLTLRTDFKPNGFNRARYGEVFVTHTFGQQGRDYSNAVIINLTAATLLETFIGALEGLPLPLDDGDGRLVFPVKND